MSSLFAPFINFGMLVGFLTFKLRQPVKDFVANRHDGIRDEILSVQDQLRIAQEKFDEFSAKLKAIDVELAALKEQAKQDALAIQQKLVADGQKMASLIVSDARAAAGHLYQELRGQLYSDLSSHVLERAEKLLQDRLTGADRVRIRQEFSHQMESIQ
jgi:F0F1-type ATP synthase membrane subunit b/b'